MLGHPPVHLCMEDSGKKFKILHFYHTPNTLKNPDAFYLAGSVKKETFRGKTTSVLTADTVLEKEDLYLRTDADLYQEEEDLYPKG